jgi:peptidoglycan/xylan/chitin deacetylase (PgdA/CDA1 family)
MSIIYTVTQIAVAGIAGPLCVGGAALLLRGRRTHRPGATPAILIHSVLDKNSPGFSYMKVDKWKSVAKYLHTGGFRTLTIQEAAGGGERDRCVAGRPSIAITFDDGFENFHRHAFPHLQEYSLRATIFPVVSCIGETGRWDSFGNRRHLTAAQLREIAAAGHEIGSHTMSHPNLRFLPGNELVRELRESKKILEGIIDGPVLSLSFPFGQWDRRVWDTAREIGYTAAAVYSCTDTMQAPLIPVRGVYSFDTLNDILGKCSRTDGFSNSHCRACIMPHFAKGTPAWKWRDTYTFFP